MSTLQCVVEGEGDVSSLPVVLRRILHRTGSARIQVSRPVRAKADQIKNGDWSHLSLAAGLARNASDQPAGVLILLDSDGEICPAELGPRWLEQARLHAPQLPCGLVIAHCEFETWFVAAAESLRGQRGLAAGLATPAAPEEIRGAKEWLTRHMPPGRCYRPTIDQPALAGRFDLDLARRNSPSFDKLWRTVEGLAAAL